MGVWIEIYLLEYRAKAETVAPFVGVWIEMNPDAAIFLSDSVAPFVGVWIEIKEELKMKIIDRTSLPSWECGLKFYIVIFITL